MSDALHVNAQARLRLSPHERCDRCGAQAYVRAEFHHGELLFCAHHAREYRDALADALLVDDQTDSL